MNENENSQNQHIAQEQDQVTDNLAQQLKECVAQKEEWKDRFLRTAADFENFKKRTEKERVLWISNAQSTLLNDLVNVVDNFDRAFEQQHENIAGFELIYKELKKLLEKYGVTEIKEVSHFDPKLHEAIMQVDSPDHKPGDIVKVLQKGYLFKGELLRPTKVSVAK